MCLLRGTDWIFIILTKFRHFSVVSCQYHSTIAPHPSSSTCRSYQKDKRSKPEKLPKTQSSFVNRAAVERITFIQSAKVLLAVPMMKGKSVPADRTVTPNVRAREQAGLACTTVNSSGAPNRTPLHSGPSRRGFATYTCQKNSSNSV